MKAARMVPRMSLTPPRITMISALRVKTTPSDASKVRNMLSSTPPEAVTAPPSAKANAEARGNVDRHKAGGRRIDGDRAQREAGTGTVQPQIKSEAEHDRADERSNAIEPVGFAENEDWARQIGVAQVFTPEYREQDSRPG